ncbi:MAG: hypothetical protein WD875_12990 [Pirellulales bacterium]
MARFMSQSLRRSYVVCACAAVAASGAMWLTARAVAQHAPPQSIRTEFQRRSQFEVSFVASTDGAADAGKEVRLYASVDRGRTWQRSGTASTKARGFSVRLPESNADGEYLFALMLAPATDRDVPNAQYRPSYRAIVDTQPPKVELYAKRTPTGAIAAHWRISDAYLDRESFQLTAGAGDNMQSVALDPQRGSTDPTTLVGSTSWWPPDGARTVSVRARVRDRAGNPAVTTVQVSIAADNAVATGAIPAAANRPDGRADSQRFDPPPTDAPPTITTDTPRNYTREASLPREDDNPASDRGQFAESPNRFAPPPSLDPHQRAAASERQQWDDPAATDQTLPRRSEQGPTIRDRHPPLNQPSNSQAEELPSPSAVRPPVTSRVGPSEDDAARPSIDDKQPLPNNTGPSDMPPGERPRVLGSRRISLQYDVASVGPSGIAEVELWSTTDGGRTWESLGIDADNRSPFTASLAGEGLYGFRLVVRNGNHVGGRAPTAGDLPEMWVVVDETKPVAAITSADVRATEGGRELVIRYEAADARLSARPVALFFADKPAGPWQTIGVSLPNTGNHVWPLDRRLGDRVYLRLEVRDEGGNVGAFETANAIVLDESEPVGRIRSVDSSRGASAERQWPRYR